MPRFLVGERVTINKRFHFAGKGTIIEIFASNTKEVENKYLVRIDGFNDFSIYKESELTRL